MTLGGKYDYMVVSDPILFFSKDIQLISYPYFKWFCAYNLYDLVFNAAAGNKMGSCAQNNDNSNITIILSRIIVFIEAVW